MFKAQIIPHRLVFKEPAGTSRGVYRTRNVHYVILTDETGRTGIGECAPLLKLSCDDRPDYEEVLRQAVDLTAKTGVIPFEDLRPWPSILCGLEMATAHLKAGSLALSDTPFARSEAGIPINGLIWMGSYERMAERIREKTAQHFHCLKLKIGAIDFEKELDLLARIREEFGPDVVELRVDANGAFSPADAKKKLERLAQFELHSIEQPIRAGNWEAMGELCRETPIPIALDEELIGINNPEEKARLLDTILPQYIILKPSLHGGFMGGDEWIKLAAERDIPYWATSALESNIGLNAIAHWCAAHCVTRAQGLGTGMLYTNNIEMPLTVKGDKLHYLGETGCDPVAAVRALVD